jgi:two-component sensor histidine kinase/CheY-like chemotaxis protein
LKILIVDDIAANRYLVEAILRSEQFEFVSVINGIEALKKLRTDFFDLIISDLMMPKMDGFILLHECKKDPILKKIPFIIYTATFTEKNDIEFGLSLGAERYLIKPLDPTDFQHIIRETLKAVQGGSAAQCSPAMASEEGFLAEHGKRISRKLEKKIQKLRGTEEELRAFRRDLDEVSQVVKEIDKEINNRVKIRTVVLEHEIEEQKKAREHLAISLEEKEVLIREMYHRVKNNLQLMISLIRLQKRQIPDSVPLTFLIDCESRIRTMALVQESLYRSMDLATINFNNYLRALATQLISLYSVNPGQIKLEISIKDIALDSSRAIPLGLIMNELIVNALKYAFPGGMSGEISVTGEEVADSYRFTIRDTGIGFPGDLDWRNTTSLGLHLVTTIMEQLQGKVDLVLDGGTAFIMTVPKQVARDMS